MKIVRTLTAGVAVMLAAAVVAAAPARPVPSEMTLEIRAMLDRNHEAVAALAREMEGAAPARRLEIQHEVSRLKREARLDLLRIQLRHAEAEGRDEAAAEIRDVLQRLTAPPVVGTPQRAAPDAARR